MSSDTLYYSPAALSGATAFIAAYVGELDLKCEIVDLIEKRTFSGVDFTTISTLGVLPCLKLADGTILTQDEAILEYLVDKSPKKLVPLKKESSYYLMKQIIALVSKSLLPPLAVLSAPGVLDTVVTFCQTQVLLTLGNLEENYMDRKPYILGKKLTVADVLLYTTLNAALTVGFDLERYPRLKQYFDRLDGGNDMNDAQTRMLGNPSSVVKGQQSKWKW